MSPPIEGTSRCSLTNHEESLPELISKARSKSYRIGQVGLTAFCRIPENSKRLRQIAGFQHSFTQYGLRRGLLNVVNRMYTLSFLILVSRGNGVTADLIHRYQTKLALQSEIKPLTTNPARLRAIWTKTSRTCWNSANRKPSWPQIALALKGGIYELDIFLYFLQISKYFRYIQ